MTNAFKVGSWATDDQTEIRNLIATATDTNYDCLEMPFGTNYQVPAGHEFIITEIIYSGNTATKSFSVSYGDNAIDLGAGPPTNNQKVSKDIKALVAEFDYRVPVFMRIHATKYIHIFGVGMTVRVQIFGYERSTA